MDLGASVARSVAWSAGPFASSTLSSCLSLSLPAPFCTSLLIPCLCSLPSACFSLAKLEIRIGERSTRHLVAISAFACLPSIFRAATRRNGRCEHRPKTHLGLKICFAARLRTDDNDRRRNQCPLTPTRAGTQWPSMASKQLLPDGDADDAFAPVMFIFFSTGCGYLCLLT